VTKVCLFDKIYNAAVLLPVIWKRWHIWPWLIGH